MITWSLSRMSKSILRNRSAVNDGKSNKILEEIEADSLMVVDVYLIFPWGSSFSNWHSIDEDDCPKTDNFNHIFKFYKARLRQSCRTVTRGATFSLRCCMWFWCIFSKPLCFRIVYLDINDLRWPASQIQIGRMVRSYVTKQSLIKPFFSIF